MRNRQEEIRSKGFDVVHSRRTAYEGPEQYGKIKVGTKVLDDAVLDLGAIPKAHRRYGNKHFVLKAIGERNLPLMREISDYFYRTNGIYSRVCDYFAFLYRYDWYIVPEIEDEKVKEEKVLSDFNTILRFLDNSHIKKICGDIALSVIKNGAYYGYLVPSKDRVILQELPINYCRSIHNIGDIPVVEFNMKFFDDVFPNLKYRMKILKMFPDEFRKGYLLYKQGKLADEDSRALIGWGGAGRDIEGRYCGTMRDGWFTLEPGAAVKFSMRNGDQPLFINAIPPLLDLDASQDIDRRKQMQQLQKIVIQELPLDKNGDLIFDVDEARDIHNNAVEMLRHSIGTDVLTTFADISVEDIADNNSSQTTDTLERMERAAYNAFGTSRNLFNTDGNLSLEKSILDDESTMRSLLFQFNTFFDRITGQLGKNKKKYCYKFYMLETTQYNYKDLAKMYKEQVQTGYSKMLPQIALGHSQSSVIHTAFFENNVLHLSEIMIPPLMSSTMNPEAVLGTGNKSNTSTSQKTTEGKVATSQKESKETGRPEKEDGQKSEKTIQNRESMN